MKGLYSWQRPKTKTKARADTTIIKKRGPRPEAPHALTPQQCEDATEPGTLNDGGGLILIIQPSNGTDKEVVTKQWRLRYTVNGRATMMGLGGYKKIDLYKARSLADAYRAQAEIGIDPAATKKRIKRNGRAPINANLSEACYSIICEVWGDEYTRTCFGEFHQFDPDGIIGAKLLAVVSGQ